MRTKWEESTYYTQIDDIINLQMAGLPNYEVIAKMIRLADQELADDMWLRNHFNTVIDWFIECETLEELENIGYSIVELIYWATEEIKLFRKYDMDADRYEAKLNENIKRLTGVEV